MNTGNASRIKKCGGTLATSHITVSATSMLTICAETRVQPAFEAL